ncbi:MAG: NUDIX domain-containing protein [Oscillospiraceae bacterium]|nr:NUDIX domain-containing protein [Oscillospiraceae bacterium]
MKVNFYDTADDTLLKFAVIISKHNNKWIFCKHRKRDTLEIPGGHRETGESIDETARRELYEETGAVRFELTPVCIYSVISDDGEETFGMFYFANITEFERELHSEIEKIYLLDDLPDKWTYPLIQPKLIDEAVQRGIC